VVIRVVSFIERNGENENYIDRGENAQDEMDRFSIVA